jgi:hypothetical protein
MQFVAGLAEFSNLFVSIELLRGRDRPAAEALVGMVPAVLRQVPCFLDRMTGRWLYDFGEPVTTTTGYVWGVGKTWHDLALLADVVTCASLRLEEAERRDYLTRLADPRKHEDMLFEFAPILRLDRTTTAAYEVTGESPGNRTIDWRIQGQDGFGLLLEVKSKAVDLIRSFERVEAGERASDGTVPAPDHDTDLLFRSIETKFLPTKTGGAPQGAWIHSALKQEGREFEKSFLKLDPERVQFVILGSWDGEVHLLTRDGVPRSKILELLRIREADRLVFDRSDRRGG